MRSYGATRRNSKLGDGNMILNGDCVEELKKLDENSVDFVITDPPYNLGFMGKKWDDAGSPLAFQEWCQEWGTELLRVMKPGAWAMIFGGTRTHHRLTAGLEDAGFEIKDELDWMYMSGFPKGQNISKFIDKYFGFKGQRGTEKINPDGGKMSARKILGNILTKTVYANTKTVENDIYTTIPESDEAKLWEGYRTCLKPAREPIIMCKKPLEGSYVENILKWGVGGVNIDGTRIPLNIENEHDPRIKNSETNFKKTNPGEASPVTFIQHAGIKTEHIQQLYEMKGRYPSNVIIDEMVAELFNMIKGYGSGKVKMNKDIERRGCVKSWNADTCGFTKEHLKNGVGTYGDSGGMSKFFKNIDKWVDPLKVVYGGQGFERSFENFGVRDGGGMGKFFYCPKASTAEREAGLEAIEAKRRDTSRTGDPANPFNRNHEVQNFHPTVKPIKLLCYLIRMIKPPTKNPIGLDPFAGSGSSGIAMRIENCSPILIEKNEDYMEIIEKRMSVPIEEFQKFTDSVAIPESDEHQLTLSDWK